METMKAEIKVSDYQYDKCDECKVDIHGYNELEQGLCNNCQYHKDHPRKTIKCKGNCGTSYCDENGCIDCKRNLAEPIPLPPTKK